MTEIARKKAELSVDPKVVQAWRVKAALVKINCFI
jgi:hypothetical protein